MQSIHLNKIEAITGLNLAELEELNLEDNKICSLNPLIPTQFPKLYELNVKYTPIDSLGFLQRMKTIGRGNFHILKMNGRNLSFGLEKYK